MSEKYNPQAIEPKWQQRWEADGLYRGVIDQDKPKYYAMTMYPYPSGELHMGHWYAMAPSDAVSFTRICSISLYDCFRVGFACPSLSA